MKNLPQSSIRRDVASAYLLAGCRVASWVVVSAAVYRRLGPDAFAMLALVRATVGLLSYTSLGLAPAMVHLLAKAQCTSAAMEGGPYAEPRASVGPVPLSYAVPDELRDPMLRVYSNGLALSLLVGAVGIVLTGWYASFFTRLHSVPASITRVSDLVMFIGLGTIARMMSDVPGAALQVRGRIAADNGVQCLGELFWAGLSTVLIIADHAELIKVAAVYFSVNLLLLGSRTGLAGKHMASVGWGDPVLRFFRFLDLRLMWQLLSYGSTVVLGQMAAFLFTPIAYILINRLISLEAVADYAPAVQIDSGLLLLITGLSAVLLPRSAVAHGAGDSRLVRRYYVRGTLLGTGLLAAGALVVWPLAPFLFKLWLGDPMPRTQAILPWVLLHTVIGGSSAVGCSILMAIGKAKSFALSALLTGVVNVALGLLFTGYFNLGLKGIVLGTLIAAILRSVVWMPWYVLRSLREVKEISIDDAMTNDEIRLTNQ